MIIVLVIMLGITELVAHDTTCEPSAVPTMVASPPMTLGVKCNYDDVPTRKEKP